MYNFKKLYLSDAIFCLDKPVPLDISSILIPKLSKFLAVSIKAFSLPRFSPRFSPRLSPRASPSSTPLT